MVFFPDSKLCQVPAFCVYFFFFFLVTLCPNAYGDDLIADCWVRASGSRVPELDDQEIIPALVAARGAKGGAVSLNPSLHLGRRSDGLRGLFARADIEPGAVLASIPRDLIVSAETDDDLDRYSVGLEPDTLQGLSSLDLLVLFVAILRERAGPCNPFFPFVQLWLGKDSDPRLSAGWAIDERRLLDGTEVGRQNDVFLTKLDDLVAKFGKEFSNRTLFDALATARTRSFAFTSLEMLLPVLELVNHDEDSAHDVSQNENGDVQLIAMAPVVAGAEILLSYGRKPASLLLSGYGFLPPIGIFAERISFDSHPNRASKLQILSSSANAEGDYMYAELSVFGIRDASQLTLSFTGSRSFNATDLCPTSAGSADNLDPDVHDYAQMSLLDVCGRQLALVERAQKDAGAARNSNILLKNYFAGLALLYSTCIDCGLWAFCSQNSAQNFAGNR